MIGPSPEYVTWPHLHIAEAKDYSGEGTPPGKARARQRGYPNAVDQSHQRTLAALASRHPALRIIARSNSICRQRGPP
eukprot:1810976-Pyramimonas_sp.AAC.1